VLLADKRIELDARPAARRLAPVEVVMIGHCPSLDGRARWDRLARDPALLGELEGLANRGYTNGFLQRHHEHDMQNYLRGHSESGRSLYVGDLLTWDAVGQRGLIEVRNRFSVGDGLEVIHPSGNRRLTLQCMHDLAGREITVAPGNGHRVWIPWPVELPGALLARFL